MKLWPLTLIPYPARAAVGINELPKGAMVEMDAVMVVEPCDYTY